MQQSPPVRAARPGLLTLAVFAVSALFLAPGCERKRPPIDPCAGDVPSVLEYRKQDGELLAVLREGLPVESGRQDIPNAPNAVDKSRGQPLCDGQRHLLGLVVGDGPDQLALKSPAGKTLASLVAEVGPDGQPGDGTPRAREAALFAGDTQRFRLHDERNLLRVLDLQGVPIGQLGFLDKHALAYTPGGLPFYIAERAQPAPSDDERRVLKTPDGAVTHFLLGLHDDRAAAAFALDRLTDAEKVLLARHLELR